MTILNRPTSQQPDYYQLLAIDPSASLKEIEKAYRRQALIHHPDRNRNPNTSQNQSTGIFQNIAQAYEVLRDPVKRIKYDLKLSKSKMDREASRDNSSSNHHVSQPSNREAKGSDRSSNNMSLFGYPGETPQYVPALHRRSASTTPSFFFRKAPAHPTETNHPIDQNIQKKQSSNHIQRPFSVSPPSHHYPESHQPFSQKIKLKDLDSLKLNLDFASRPHARPSQSSSDHRSLPTRSNSLNPHLQGGAPDPYLTFERAWGKNLDDIIDGIIDREIEQKKQLNNRKSHTDPMPIDQKPRIVHRSATVRSADSDYRPAAYDHPQRRPRSASGDGVRDNHQFSMSRGGPQSVPVPIPREMSSPVEDMRPYLPPSSHHVRSRRMSTGPEHLFNSGAVHDPHRFYRPMNNSSSTSSSVPFMHDRGGRRSATTSPTLQPSSSPQEVPFFSQLNHGPSRHRASTSGLGKEFREVIIRFERESDGSTRLSKEMKSRTIDLDGTVHDRYRRQRSAAVN